MLANILSTVDVFKIGGLAGVVTLFFWLIVRTIIGVVGGMSPKQRMTIILVILFMAFSLSAFGMYIFFANQMKEDGGVVGEVAQEWRNQHVFWHESSCAGVQAGTSHLWMSFNEQRPYYRVHDYSQMLRVVLQSISDTEARFVINSPNGLIAAATLKVSESVDFTWNECRCRLVFIGKLEENAGWQYLFR